MFDILFDILKLDEFLDKRHRLKNDQNDKENDNSRKDREKKNDNIFELFDVDNAFVSFTNTTLN
jgi:hypothetical protein